MKNDTEFSRIKPDLIEYLSASEDNEDEDIRDLRIRKMKELQYKEVEIKRQHEKERILKQQRLEEMQKIREFDGKKITLDHEGKVIYIKDLNIDKLAVDFSSPKNIIKDKTSISKINKMNSKKKLSSLSSIVNVNRGISL